MIFNLTKRSTLLVTVAVLFCAIGGLALSRIHAETSLPKISYLKPDQDAGVKRVDEMLASLSTQYASLQTQRAAVITGFALSDSEISKLGLDWANEYELIKDAAGYGFRKLTDEQKKQRAEAAAAQSAGK